MTDDIHIGLCQGRHDIRTNNDEEITDFMFGEVESPLDFQSHHQVVDDWIDNLPKNELYHGCEYTLYLYVTGLTPLLTAFLSRYFSHLIECASMNDDYHNIPVLVLMHYNRDTEKYEEERVS